MAAPVAKNAKTPINNRRDKFIKTLERQHVNRRTLIRKRNHVERRLMTIEGGSASPKTMPKSLDIAAARIKTGCRFQDPTPQREGVKMTRRTTK
jgi:hypothetical protein